jgi:hypothetical protein
MLRVMSPQFGSDSYGSVGDSLADIGLCPIIRLTSRCSDADQCVGQPFPRWKIWHMHFSINRRRRLGQFQSRLGAEDEKQRKGVMTRPRRSDRASFTALTGREGPSQATADRLPEQRPMDTMESLVGLTTMHP